MPERLHKVLYFLGTMDDQDVDWMVLNGKKRQVPAGQAIIHEGRETEDLFFILQGEFRVSVGGREVSVLQQGELVGEISFVDSRPPTATVTATTDAVVGVVPVAALEEKLREDVAFASRFYKAIAVALADRMRARNTLGGSSRAVADDDDDFEVAPHLLDVISLAGNRFADMQRRSWGGA